MEENSVTVGNTDSDTDHEKASSSKDFDKKYNQNKNLLEEETYFNTDGPARRTRAYSKSPKVRKTRLGEKRTPMTEETKMKIGKSVKERNELKKKGSPVVENLLQSKDKEQIEKPTQIANIPYDINTGIVAINPTNTNGQFGITQGTSAAHLWGTPFGIYNPIPVDLNIVNNTIDEKLSIFSSNMIGQFKQLTHELMQERKILQENERNKVSKLSVEVNEANKNNFNINHLQKPNGNPNLKEGENIWERECPERRNVRRDYSNLNPVAPISPPRKKRFFMDRESPLDKYLRSCEERNYGKRMNFKDLPHRERNNLLDNEKLTPRSSSSRNLDNNISREQNNFPDNEILTPRSLHSRNQDNDNRIPINLSGNRITGTEGINRSNNLTIKEVLSKPPEYTHLSLATEDEVENEDLKKIWIGIKADSLKWLTKQIPRYNSENKEKGMNDYIAWFSEISTQLRQVETREATFILTRLLKSTYTKAVLENHRRDIAGYSLETVSQLYGQEIYRQLKIDPIDITDSLRVGKDGISSHKELMKRIADIHACRSNIILPVVWCDDLVRALARHLNAGEKTIFIQRVLFRYPYLQDFADYHRGKLDSTNHLPNEEQAKAHMPLDGKDCKEFSRWVVSLACGREYDISVAGLNNKQTNQNHNSQRMNTNKQWVRPPNNQNRPFNPNQFNQYYYGRPPPMQHYPPNYQGRPFFPNQMNPTNWNRQANHQQTHYQQPIQTPRPVPSESTNELAVNQTNIKKENIDPNAKCFKHPKGDHTNAQCYVQHPELKPKQYDQNKLGVKNQNSKVINEVVINQVTEEFQYGIPIAHQDFQYGTDAFCYYSNPYNQEGYYYQVNQIEQEHQIGTESQYQNECLNQERNDQQENNSLAYNEKSINEINTRETIELHQDSDPNACTVNNIINKNKKY